MTYPPKAELLINGTWMDVSARLRRSDPPIIRRGRADESSRVQPTSLSARLDNQDGWLTPGNAESPWWPHVDLGAQVRVSVDGRRRFLLVPTVTGAAASTPDHASLDITGDIHIRAELIIDNWGRGVVRTIASKYVDAGTQRSWWFFITANNRLVLQWTPDGTLASAHAPQSSPIPTSSGRIGLGVKLDVNNGAGQHVVTFETAPSLDGPWTDLHTEVRAGTTSIRNSTAALQVGAVSSPAVGQLDDRVPRLQLRNGINGTVVANPDFTAQPIGTTGFTDGAGRAWSINGAASISRLRSRFRGSISQVKPVWPQATKPDDLLPGVARVEIEADGTLRRLSQGQKPLHSAMYRLVTSTENVDNVLAYWPLEDGSAATRAASPIANVAPMVLSGSARFSGESEPFAGSDSLVSIGAGEPFGWNGAVPSGGTLTNWAVEWFVKVPTPETNPSATVLGLIYTSGSIRYWRVALSSTNITVRGHDRDGVEVVTASISSSSFPDGDDWAGLRFQVVQNGGTIEWDFAFWTVGVGTLFGIDGSISGTVGRPTQLACLDTSPPDGMSVGHMIVTYDRTAGWLSPADVGWDGEAAGERIERLCGEEGVPIRTIGDPADTTLMGPQRPATLPNLLHDCADADMGILADQRNGQGLQYRTRRSLYNQEPALTLDASARGVVEPFAPLRNDQRIRNDITVSRTDGSSFQDTDDDSIDRHGRYDEAIDLNVQSDDQLGVLAGWRLHQGTWDEMRYGTISVQLGQIPDLIDTWLDMDLGDRVLVTNLPRQHPNDVDQLIEHSEEQFPYFQLPVEWTVSPARLWDVGVLDTQRLDSDGATLATGIDSDDTSLTVTVNPAWTTLAADFPLDIEIGGELMTVSAISGASSPQTFVISARSVNGVVKAHAAGAEVHVADPLRFAL